VNVRPHVGARSAEHQIMTPPSNKVPNRNTCYSYKVGSVAPPICLWGSCKATGRLDVGCWTFDDRRLLKGVVG